MSMLVPVCRNTKCAHDLRRIETNQIVKNFLDLKFGDRTYSIFKNPGIEEGDLEGGVTVLFPDIIDHERCKMLIALRLLKNIENLIIE